MRRATRNPYAHATRTPRNIVLSTALLGALLGLLSCGGEDTSGPRPGPPPTATIPARVTLDPETVAVVAGDTVRVRARVLNDRAQPISDAVVTWTSSDPTIATVDATGLVSGLKEGNASLTAASGSVTASAPVAVHSQDRAILMELHNEADGASWTNRENWGSEEPIGSWYGVEANADARVTALRLSENGLTGQLPANLGDLAFLTELQVDGNEGLSGPIPFSLSELGIQTFNYGGTMLCTVRDEGFQAWLNAVPTRDGEFIACNEARSDLMTLYDAMGGDSWTDSENWGTDAPLEDWYGIAVDSEGRVTQINLNRNNLSGTVPPEIRSFPHLRLLRLDYNRLEGEIPPEIGELTELRRTDMDGNEFKGRIPPEIGKLVNLQELWMGGNQMTGPIPAEFGNLASLRRLYLYEARFDGSIPPEFGALTELRGLEIWDTRVGGSIPAELGALPRLDTLRLQDNRFEGALPPELGDLPRLRWLNVSNNRLSGPLPAELGQLDRLRILLLNDNMIDGPLPAELPAELGQLDRLRQISAQNNMLSGPVPPELGDASRLVWLHVQNNPDLSGPLPDELTSMTALEELIAYDTGLCAPTEPEFRAWLNDVVAKWRVRSCGAEGHAEAYLTQATQSREFPVPLVAGESALLRVFVMSEAETTENVPPVRATFFVDGAEVHVANIPAGSSPIPTEVQVGELDLSANAEIPAEVIQPGLEMVVEVDPDGTVDAALGVAKRIPAEGRAAVEVREVPPLLLTLVPFIAENNREAATFVARATPDDDLFFEVNTLLPVGVFEITKHPSVTVSSDDIFDMLGEMDRIRMVEDGIGHWMGLSANTTGAAGVAYLGANPNPNRGKVSVSRLSVGTIAHELGHNLNLWHADCGDPALVDRTFPYDNARTGVWGYDPRDGGSLVPSDWADMMSYCNPNWVSDYNFTNALRFRLQDTVEVWPAASRTLIVSGGAAADGALHLDPAFVIETSPVVPRSGGPYELTGSRADGSELFSLSFDMGEIWDGEGRSGFTFALPVQAEWESELASLALTGPGGTVEMREGSEPPMAILRDPVTGQVRAILRDLPAGPLARSAADALAPEPGLEVMVSSGLPDASMWRR
ncbi:leucine-rich repeat domain-containing protein [Candidatus Palauibacter sp.]|uniref:leucine-rich repeat domain-containing protein n=1 Tax=Candidatus Palauibacter sp. TaxID=3101350 RepID=UPI003B5CAD66